LPAAKLDLELARPSASFWTWMMTLSESGSSYRNPISCRSRFTYSFIIHLPGISQVLSIYCQLEMHAISSTLSASMLVCRPHGHWSCTKQSALELRKSAAFVMISRSNARRDFHKAKRQQRTVGVIL